MSSSKGPLLEVVRRWFGLREVRRTWRSPSKYTNADLRRLRAERGVGARRILNYLKNGD